MELPPRARRIPPPNPRNTINRGTTSACAENTAWVYASCGIIWNYLRVRGEYSEETLIDAAKRELPPRARRILAGSDTDFDVYGTTSACAENTSGR